MTITTSRFFSLLQYVYFKIHVAFKGNNKFCKNIALATFAIPLSFIIVLSTYTIQHPANAASIMKIDTGDNWSFFKGTDNLPQNWYSIDFDDSGWYKGAAGYGYGYGSGTYITILNDMQGTYKSVYARRQFVISNPEIISALTLSVICDDSFAAYINGIEVIRNNTQMNESIDIRGFIHELQKGKNVLAVQCSNDDIASDSYSFNPKLEILYK